MGDDGFYSDIKKFNDIYKLPSNERPTLIGVQRLKDFKSILGDELKEIDEIISLYEKSGDNPAEEQRLEILTSLSDWLGDIMVYVASEARRHGISMKKTLDIIMQSNFSKLDGSGNPIYDERRKVMKGPNYWKPEPKISELLKERLKE